MEAKLKKLIGQSDVWLFVQSSNGWLKNVEVIEVNSTTVTFRYQQESPLEIKVWEKTTRLDNILEIDVMKSNRSKCQDELDTVRDRLTRLLDQE